MPLSEVRRRSITVSCENNRPHDRGGEGGKQLVVIGI